jgi:hypothetical protein
MIRYKVRPDAVERNLELVRAVHAELAARRPAGVRYASFQLADEVSFMDVVWTEAGPGPLMALASWEPFRATLADRCEEPPSLTELRELGAFGWA